MDTTRIAEANKAIAACEAAMGWFETHGHSLSEKGAVRMDLGIINQTDGASDASRMLRAYAIKALPDLVETCLQNCRNTIEIERDAIRRELDRPDTGTKLRSVK